MTTATLVLIILLWPLCLFIIGLILLQGGAGDISSAFGGGGQLDSTLGVGAGRKMSKLTSWLAGTFLVLVIALSIQSKGDLGRAAGVGASKPGTSTDKTTDKPGVPAVQAPASNATDTIKPDVSAPTIGPLPAIQPAPTVPVHDKSVDDKKSELKPSDKNIEPVQPADAPKADLPKSVPVLVTEAASDVAKPIEAAAKPADAAKPEAAKPAEHSTITLDNQK